MNPKPLALEADAELFEAAADGGGAPTGDGVVSRPAHAAFEDAVQFADFDAFVTSYSRMLVRCAFLIVGDAGAASDVVQTALVKVAGRWPALVANGHPLAYVRSAVVRTAITSKRRKWHGEVSTGALPDRAVADAMAVVDSRDRLRRALATLPPRQRAVVVLRYYLDLDEAAAAATLGCSVGTIKSQGAKGLARLRLAIDAPRREEPS